MRSCAATPLRKINLRMCIQLFGAFLSVTESDKLHSWEWHHTPPTENTHYKISSLALRRSAIKFVLVTLQMHRFTAHRLLIKVQWIFYSWRHTKPTSIRNKSGYKGQLLSVGVPTLQYHTEDIWGVIPNFWKAQSNWVYTRNMHVNMTSLTSQTHFMKKEGKGLVNCVYKPCPTTLYSVGQSHCSILSHDALHRCL